MKNRPAGLALGTSASLAIPVLRQAPANEDNWLSEQARRALKRTEGKP